MYTGNSKLMRFFSLLFKGSFSFQMDLFYLFYFENCFISFLGILSYFQKGISTQNDPFRFVNVFFLYWNKLFLLFCRNIVQLNNASVN